MGMTIEEIIKYLPAPICGDIVIGKEKQKEYDAHDSAVIILRKYQKIEQIMESDTYKGIFTYTDDTRLNHIREVLENGRN